MRSSGTASSRPARRARRSTAVSAVATTRRAPVPGSLRTTSPTRSSTASSAWEGPSTKTSGTIPPYNGHAKLAPENPLGVANDLAKVLGEGIGVAIIDANDISVNILGHSDGVDPQIVRELLLDNPLGQGHEQTPVALLRSVADVKEIA